MCGRYVLMVPWAVIHDLLLAKPGVDPYPPRFNIAPTQPIVAIWQEQGARASHLARWGLVPGWVKDPRDFPLLTNARAETLAEKPAFRDCLRNKRCIIPASGYYEWHTAEDGTKQPYYITLADDAPMLFAGLYSIWAGPNGEEVDTVAIVTTAANGDLDHIHHRMPVVLRGEAVDLWLDTGAVDAKAAMSLLHSLPEGTTKAHPVDKRVGSGKIDDAGLIVPVERDATMAKPKPKKPAKPSDPQLDLF